jgi:hypothetical protein
MPAFPLKIDINRGLASTPGGQHSIAMCDLFVKWEARASCSDYFVRVQARGETCVKLARPYRPRPRLAGRQDFEPGGAALACAIAERTQRLTPFLSLEFGE